jgi:hypothetical protein
MMAEGIGTFKPKADKAPKGRPSNTKSKALPADRPFKSTPTEIRKSLESALGMAIMALAAKGWDDDARILEEDGTALIDQWLWLSERSPFVRRALETLTGGGGYATFAMVNLGVILGILQNHGHYPDHLPTPRSLQTMFMYMGTPDAENDDSARASTSGD